MSVRARVVRVAVSYVLVALGVASLVRADVGVAPFDVLNTGVSETLDIRFGFAFLITSVVFYATGIALGGKAGWASIVGTVVIAPMVEGALAVLPERDVLALRIPLFVVGVSVLVAGVCLVITTELGAGPGEVFMLGLIARGVSVTRSRWLTDGLAFVVGVVLGGAVGAGTLVFAFAFGPLVARGLRLLGYTPPVRIAEAIVAP